MSSTQVEVKVRSIKSIDRSEEHTSEPSHGYISYAVFCLKKKNNIEAAPVNITGIITIYRTKKSINEAGSKASRN